MNHSRTSVLLDRVDAEVRKLLIDLRVDAMHGRLVETIGRIGREIGAKSQKQSDANVVALASLKAELLFLDYQDQASLEVFDESILPYARDLAHEERFVIELNRIEPKRALIDPAFALDYYNLVDRQKLVGFELFDFQEFLAAEDAVAEGKHYEALPALWRGLQHSYRQGSWFAYRWASRRFATECLRLGLPDEAAYHAAMSQDTSLAGPVGDQIVAARNPELVQNALSKLMSLANLGRHFVVASALIAKISDAIPDSMIDRVADWVRRRCDDRSGLRYDSRIAELAWRALAEMSDRISPPIAVATLETATHSPLWLARPTDPNKVILGREHIVNTVNGLTPALPKERMELLAHETLALLNDRMQPREHPEAFNLLCRLAMTAGEPIKEMIGDALFPAGKSPSYLDGQVSDLFGKPFLSDDELNRVASKVATHVRLTVQRLAQDEEAQAVPLSLMTQTSIDDGRKLVVTITNGVDLRTLSLHQDRLRPPALRDLARACLELSADPDNLLSNRAQLVHEISLFARSLGREEIDACFSMMMPMAHGRVDVAPRYEHPSYTNNPLSRTRIGVGSVRELRQSAIISLARLETAQPGHGDKFDAVLEAAMRDNDAEVRGAAFLAARHLPALSKPILLATLLGTRDADPDAAAEAFAAFRNKPALLGESDHWYMFTYSARMAALSQSSKLRKYVPLTLGKLRVQATLPINRSEIDSLLALFASDSLHSVRLAAQQAASDGAGNGTAVDSR